MKGIREDIRDIRDDLKTVTTSISKIECVQEAQANTLAQHVKRTNILEDKVIPLALDRAVKERNWSVCGKIVLSLSAIVGALVGVARLIKYLS